VEIKEGLNLDINILDYINPPETPEDILKVTDNLPDNLFEEYTLKYKEEIEKIPIDTDLEYIKFYSPYIYLNLISLQDIFKNENISIWSVPSFIKDKVITYFKENYKTIDKNILEDILVNPIFTNLIPGLAESILPLGKLVNSNVEINDEKILEKAWDNGSWEILKNFPDWNNGEMFLKLLTKYTGTFTSEFLNKLDPISLKKIMLHNVAISDYTPNGYIPRGRRYIILLNREDFIVPRLNKVLLIRDILKKLER
jgi:hypothetical protein